jgi:Fur family transcriptional regulator, ferric uptake regulator
MLDKIIKERLDQAEYKLTRQRKAVLEVMRENRGEHLTAEEVLTLARVKAPNLGIATVYRTLERMAALSIVYKAIFNEDKYRYELIGLEEHEHHHILCVNCGKIFEVADGLLDSLEEHLEAEGFEIINHQLKVYALCSACKKR